MDWRDLKRHPLSAEYKDLKGAAFEKFCATMKVVGFLADRPIILYEDQILDGWQRHRGCVATDTEPVFGELPEDVTPASYVAAVNDFRRHETPEEESERVQARLAKVEELYKEGKTVREIAVLTGMSKSQADRDITRIVRVSRPKVEFSKPAPPKPVKILCQGCKDKVAEGKKKVSRCNACKKAAQMDKFKDLLCQRCTEVGYQDGCGACDHLRSSARAGKPAKDKITDDNGTVVPQRLVDVFATVPDFEEASKLLNQLAHMYKKLENGPTRTTKSVDPSQHFRKFVSTFKAARARIKAMRPAIIHEPCGGEGCSVCDAWGTSGYVTTERKEAYS